jgi:hypothetical protein
MAAANLGFSGTGLTHGPVVQQGDERMQPVFSLVDPVEKRLGQFHGRKFAVFEHFPGFVDC